jgi:hypothetical protein
VEKRKLTLEKELRSVLAPGESENIFLNDTEGIWFGGHVRLRNGKPIALNVPNKADMKYIQQAESRLQSPQSKRDFTTSTNNPNNRPPAHITYSGLLQARTRTTQSVSVQDTEGTTTTTTTQISQTVTALMEARFQGIETEMKNQKEHQHGMDQCLSHLENRTTSINDNIAAMMEHWNITPSQKRRAVSVMHHQQTEQNTHLHNYGDGEVARAADSNDMDHGEMEE